MDDPPLLDWERTIGRREAGRLSRAARADRRAGVHPDESAAAILRCLPRLTGAQRREVMDALEGRRPRRDGLSGPGRRPGG